MGLSMLRVKLSERGVRFHRASIQGCCVEAHSQCRVPAQPGAHQHTPAGLHFSKSRKTNTSRGFFLSHLRPNTHSSVMSAQSCDMLTSGRLSERDRQAGRPHAGEEEEEGGSTYRGSVEL